MQVCFAKKGRSDCYFVNGNDHGIVRLADGLSREVQQRLSEYAKFIKSGGDIGEEYHVPDEEKAEVM